MNDERYHWFDYQPLFGRGAHVPLPKEGEKMQSSQARAAEIEPSDITQPFLLSRPVDPGINL